MNIPRPEYPNPQFERENWLNLNGEWDFIIDNECSGEAKGYVNKDGFDQKIVLPFCPESKLSGIAHTDFMRSVWYKRSVTLTDEQLRNRVFLHIGACDYQTDIWVGDAHIGTHKGGYTHFAFDVTAALKVGENLITIRAIDDTLSLTQPTGKQSERYESFGCYYTRTTGIWQTVWLEFVSDNYIKNFRFYPDADNASVTAVIEAEGYADAEMYVYYEGKQVGFAKANNCGSCYTLSTTLSEKHLWELGVGRLYDVVLKFGDDVVKSYFGLRSATMAGKKFLLNGQSVYQRLVLDQGFYPDGIYTAPNEDALIKDIELSMAAGFNGARLHQKVFEPRFLYHCDKKGYIVWGEYPSWGFDFTEIVNVNIYINEWLESVARDFNHPAIVCWCPINETWNRANEKRQDNEALRVIYNVTKAMDTTRPCIDTSGNFHVVTDIYDLHDYCQDTDEFDKHCKQFGLTGEPWDNFPERQKYEGQPLCISEYGGISLSDDGWGYGDKAKSVDEFIERYQKLTNSLLDYKECFSFCYTQLYDVEQEINGLYDYYRNPKCDISKIYEINTKKAAIE